MQSQSISHQAGFTSEAHLLRRALQSDALFSLLSSLIFIFAAGPVARFLGPSVPSWLILVIGLSFLPFVADIYWVLSDLVGRVRYGRIIAILNFVWVVGSYLVLWLAWSQLTVASRWFIALQAEVIFLFAVLQTVGLRRLTR
ncbi:MAG: hypothetical protein H6654_13760 [Ardenticatenaceae bacterium]|nr:hypothetical protein [Anaerolineales bacterium]MCB8941485.1 hypothetical protein [Ardenticatenaceae bacterium]MCB8974621.1 hypothetical protein [Ardenticatenaceae bacterium]